MKIDVCVKQVPASNETRLDPVTHTIIRDSAGSILNPFDAYAVEEALLLRERCGGTVKAFSMGIPAAAEMLRRVLALGVDDALLLTDRAFAGSDTLATSRVLAAAIRADGLPDLILCGRESTDFIGSEVGEILAELLGVPFVTNVVEFTPEGDDLKIKKELDAGYLIVQTPKPALYTVSKPDYDPRYPTIKSKLAARKVQIPTLDGVDGDAARVEFLGYQEPPKREAGVKIMEDEPADAVAKAFELLTADKVL